MLNSRQSAILEQLLAAAGPVPMHTLGDALGISRRVVRYNLPMINYWLEAHGARLETRPRVGVQLHVPRGSRQDIAGALARARQSTLFSQQARLNALRFELLTSRTYRNRSDLQRLFSVSSATLSRDLTQSEPTLETNNLHLERRPRRGIRIVGSEADVRHAVVSLLLQLDLSPALLDRCLGRADRTMLEQTFPQADQQFVLKRTAAWDLAAAWQCVSDIESGSHIRLADADRLVLAIHWALMETRAPHGLTVAVPDTVRAHLASLPQRAAVRQIVEARARSVGLAIEPDETDHLALLVSTSLREQYARSATANTIVSAHDEALIGSLASRLVGEFSSAAFRRAALSEVTDRLRDHLLRALARLRHGLPIRNPLAAEVRQAYPALWHSACSIVASYEERLSVSFPPDEIAFLTMYVALVSQLTQTHRRQFMPRVLIVCPTGGITVQMLLHRLRDELPEIAIVDVISLRQLAEIDTTQVDAVISTARLALPDLPVITISPLVSPEDLSVLRRELNLTR